MVGYGWVSGAHIAAISATGLAEVRAICSRRELDADALSRKHGSAIRCYRDYGAMLADADLDVISICSYPQDHASQAVAASRAGKHLIIEKPLALTWADCLAVSEAVRQNKSQTCVCFECRYSSQFLAIKSVLDQGWLGQVHYGEVDYYHGIGSWYGQYRWNITEAAGGSSLLSAGCHAMDALLLCLGTEVKSVSGFSSRSSHPDFARYEYPTTSVTILQFKNGSVGKVASSIDAIQPYYFHTHLIGSEGSLLDNKFHSARLGGLDKSRWSELSMRMLDSGDVSDHPYETQFKTFFQALEKNQPMPLTGLNEALTTHRVIFAADQAARENRVIEL